MHITITMSIFPALIMASHLSCLLLVSSIALPYTFVGGVQQITHTNVSLDSSLHPTTPPTSWLSPSGLFAFGFYPEGSGFSVGAWLIKSPGNITVIWKAFRDEPPFPKNTTLKLTPKGLKLLQATSEDRSVSETSLSANAAYASMLNSGNFAVYSSSFVPVWETFDHPTDTIMSGQALSKGNRLISGISETNHSQGRFRLNMQTDGNLVLYPLDTSTSLDAYWASGTFDQDFSSLNLDSNGRLFLLGSNVSASHNLTGGLSTNSMLDYLARLDADGFFRLYSYNPAEQTMKVLAKFPDVIDVCFIKGACGMNSYCSSTDKKVACLCLPGFVYLDPQQTSSGCVRNFTASTSCQLAGGGGNVTMEILENTDWGDDPYMTPLSADSKEECSDACLADCNCEVVFFSGATCTKQKFPIKYGRRDTGQVSTVAYIKVDTDTGRGLAAAQGDPASPAFKVQSGSKKRMCSTTEIFIILSAALAVGLAISLIAFGFLVYKYRAVKYRRMTRNRDGLAEELNLRSFSYKELLEATGGFKEKLGNGSFGTVFKGALVSPGVNIFVAVKRLEKAAVGEGEREFQTEMRAIGRTHHRNLVRLLGFCDEGSNRLLVYEFMSNGSLADLIFNPLATEAALPEWSERVRIALDVARGIHYLHEECESRIIHCDIKPHNILMDDHWTAKISDFGMAKLLLLNQSRTFTQVRGTRGYLAPEWHKNAPITAKADIYSFGVVLLEIICCRKNLEVEAQAPEEILLLEWVYSCYVNGELAKLVPDEEVDSRELERFVKVGLWCIQNEPALRPDMKKVVMMLEGNIQVYIPPPPASVQ